MEIRPEIRFDLIPVWEAFIELHNRRRIGFQANPISTSSIIDWFDVMGYGDVKVRQYMFGLIAFLDDMWVGANLKKRKNVKGQQ